MKDMNRVDKLYSYFNAIRGNNTVNEYQETLAVLKKTMDLQASAVDENFNPCKLSDDELYEVMKSIASDFGIDNPFSDKDRFFNIYKTLNSFEDVSWEDIMEYGDRRSKFRVPEVLIDVMEQNFVDGFQEVLIPEAEKFSPCLERMVKAHGDSHFTLTTMDNFYFKVLSEMFSDNDI